MKTSSIIYIVIIILLVVIIWKYVKKSNPTSGNVSTAQTTFSTIANSFIPKPVLTSTLPTTPTATNTGFKFGDLVYAISNTTNTYKNPILSTANLDSYKAFNANDLIGTYLGANGSFAKINATNPARVIYVLSSQIYTK